jgi:hypothetical protein
MPSSALKHLAKQAKISVERAEHLWNKAKEIVDAEYPYDKKDERYWALRMGITKRMMGLGENLSFKDFLSLNEASVGKKPQYQSLEVERAIEELNRHAKDALWMLYENRPLYRGDRSNNIEDIMKTGFATVDPSATRRKSENTSNYYTVILDNHPDYKDFPKRSRSFIGTTNLVIAQHYSGLNKPLIMIPYDDVKIGMVNERDIWGVRISPFNHTMSMDFERANRPFKRMGINPNIKSFEDFDKLLKSGDRFAIENLKKAYDLTNKEALKYSKRFMEEIWRAYSPKETGFRVYTTKTLPRKYVDTEVWVGGKVMLIDVDMWDDMRDALKQK